MIADPDISTSLTFLDFSLIGLIVALIVGVFTRGPDDDQ